MFMIKMFVEVMICKYYLVVYRDVFIILDLFRDEFLGYFSIRNKIVMIRLFVFL